MSGSLLLQTAGDTRSVAWDELPLTIGGRAADIGVSEDGGDEAWIAADGDDLFIQPAAAASRVRCNDAPVATSQWLRDGDLIAVGETRIAIGRRDGNWVLRVEREDDGGAPPVLTPPPRDGAGRAAEPQMIAPVAFEPRSMSASGARPGRGRWAMAFTWIGLAVLAAAAWFTFTARTVELRVEPAPDRLEIDGPLPRLSFAGRHLLRSGAHRVVAEKEGYRRLERELVVTAASHQVHDLRLELLPGLLVVRTDPAEGVTVSVDGRPVGETPLEPLELDAGEHEVEASAERHRPASATVSVGGAGSKVEVELALAPLWAEVSFASRPTGALVRVDGEAVGRTPLTAEVLEGRRAVELRLDGYKPYRDALRVVASEPQSMPSVTLEPVDGWLVLTSEPAGATVSVDGVYRGVTPLELELAPGDGHRLEASLRGYKGAKRSFAVASGTSTDLHLELEPELGEVEIRAQPADAELWIDGEPRGRAEQTLTLPAVPHRVEIVKEGFETATREVTPRPGFPQTLSFVLTTVEEAREQAAAELNPPVIESPQGQRLVLVQPGRFRMGASRREPGRRANETLREVELTRAFYLATQEVSNAEFREFLEGHRAGVAGGSSLDLDDHPVVEVTWEEAARYCNWLSEKASLEPYYVERGGTLAAADPEGTGFRLPTEAEWEWAARYAGRREATKYPWGDSLPVPPGSGNYADASASAVLPATVPGYDDGFPATAPVASFEPNPLGVSNLGGNVAEWVHDLYTIYSSVSTDVAKDPRGPDEGELHVIRGSSWMHSTVTELRLSYRDYGNAARSDVGFRIARYAN